MEAVSLGKDFRLGRATVLHAVRDVSFGLYRGAVVALVGESGSGKSTVARLLAGQERLTGRRDPAGRDAGRPVAAGGRSARYKSEVQLVFQDPFASLNPVHTVRYHLERPVRLHQGRKPRAEVRARSRAAGPGAADPGRAVHRRSTRTSCPAASGSGSRSPARSPPSRACCWPTSRCRCWTSRSGWRCSACSTTCASGCSWRCCTSRTTSRRPATSPTRSWSCTPGRSSSAGPAEEVTQQPAHPYTQLLVASAPDPDNLGGTLRAAAPVAGRRAAGRRRPRPRPQARATAGLPVQPPVPAR